MTIENKLKAEAERLGFLISGITTPDPPASFPQYSSWIEKGLHAGMGYLASARALEHRANPRRLLTECQSILVLGMPYAHPNTQVAEDQNNPRLMGKIASYAWGNDYHKLILPRLQTLAGWLQGQLGIGEFLWKGYTDSGPLLERDLGTRAGLGWIGRNTNLINPSLGSHFFLAEILLPVDLQPDVPFDQDRCGNCLRCIQACPTNCILPDRTIDASRCISYLTIENKSEIPIELRSQLNTWVFGCDVCQSVCPWNNKTTEIKIDPALCYGITIQNLDLHTAFKLTPQEFNKTFRHSPIKRAKRRGFLRNCTVALGNTPHKNSIPVLAKVMASEVEPLVRCHAAWALGNILDQSAFHALESAQHIEQDPSVLVEIKAAIEKASHGYGSHAGE